MNVSNSKPFLSFSYSNVILMAVMIVLAVILMKRYFLWGYCQQVSEMDGKPHRVQCDYEDKETASNLLSVLNSTAEKLIQHLSSKYKDKKNDRGDMTRNLIRRYRGADRLVETNPNNRLMDTAFTLDKGYLVSMCLRTSKDKNLSKFHEQNLLKFVFIHELTHIAANVQNHPPRFWEAFRWILTEASDIGLYVPKDYAKETHKVL